VRLSAGGGPAHALAAGDGAALSAEGGLAVEALDDAEVLLFDLA
jgi:hypothetical protein